jgi:hypothetical protein
MYRNQALGSLETLQVGDNFILQDCRPGGIVSERLQNLFRAPDLHRVGCFLANNYVWNGKRYLCFVFDIPYNTNLQGAEMAFLNEINLPSTFDLTNHICLIHEHWMNQVSMKKIDKIASRSIVKCKLPDCSQVCYQCQLISLCDQHSHHCCHSHFKPTGNDGVGFTDDTRDFLKSKSHDLEPFLESAVRYLYFLQANFNFDIRKLLPFIIDEQMYLCPFCLLEYKQNPLPLDILDHQLNNPIGFIDINEDYEMITHEEAQGAEEAVANNQFQANRGLSKLSQRNDEIPQKPFVEDRERQLQVRNNYQNRITSNPIYNNKSGSLEEKADSERKLEGENIPFRESNLWLSLTLSTQVRLNLWQQEFARQGCSEKEIEHIYSTQSREELEDLTIRVLKVLIFSYHDEKEKKLKEEKEKSSVQQQPQQQPQLPVSINNNYEKSQSRSIEVDNSELLSRMVSPLKPMITGKLMQLKIVRPEDPEMIKVLNILSNFSYDQVLRSACELFQLYARWQSMSLVRRDYLGWNIKIYPELISSEENADSTTTPKEQKELLLWGMVENNDLLELRRTSGAFLGGRYYLNEISHLDRCNKSIQQKIEQLNENYIGYREIRGDGNCYYRAVFCGIIEKIITSAPLFGGEGNNLSPLLPSPSPSPLQKHHSLSSMNSAWSLNNSSSIKTFLSRDKAFQYLTEKFRSVMYKSRPRVQHGALIKALSEAAGMKELFPLYEIFLLIVSFFFSEIENKRWLTIEEFEADMLDEDSGLDEASIYDCKKLITQFIMDHKEKEFNGLTLENAIMFTNENYKELPDYCVQEILKMEVCAEGPPVELGILPSLLGAKCEIIFLDREEANQLSIRQTNVIEMEQVITEISLLFRPGHYDLLYKRDSPSKKDETDTEVKSDKAVSETKAPLPVPRIESPTIDLPSLNNRGKSSPNTKVSSPSLPPKIPGNQQSSQPLQPAPLLIPNPQTNERTTISSSPKPPLPPPEHKKAIVSSQTVLSKKKELPLEPEKPVTSAEAPKMSKAELYKLVEKTVEQYDDYALSRQHSNLMELLEMGFTVEFLLDVWMKYRYELLCAIHVGEWLDKIEVMKRESSKKAVLVPEATEQKKVIHNDFLSSNKNNIDTTRSSNDDDSVSSSSTNNEKKPKKKFEDLTVDDQMLLKEFKKKHGYFESRTLDKLQQYAIDFRMDHYFPLGEVLQLMSKNPFAKKREMYETLKKTAVLTQPNTLSSGPFSTSNKIFPAASDDSLDALTNDRYYPSSTTISQVEKDQVQNLSASTAMLRGKENEEVPKKDLSIPSSVSTEKSSPFLASALQKGIVSSATEKEPASLKDNTQSNESNWDGYFVLYQMKKLHPHFAWDRIEPSVKGLYDLYDVPMKVLLQAVEKGCILPESMKDFAVEKLKKPLKRRSSSRKPEEENESFKNQPDEISIKGMNKLSSKVTHIDTAPNSDQIDFTLSKSASPPPSNSHQQPKEVFQPLNLLYRDHQDIFNYLVLDLNLPEDLAREAIERNSCYNIRSAITYIRITCHQQRVMLIDLKPREKDNKLDKAMKELIFKTTLEFGYPVDDVLDAIAFDKCLEISDVVDSMESKQLREKQLTNQLESSQKTKEIDSFFNNFDSQSAGFSSSVVDYTEPRNSTEAEETTRRYSTRSIDLEEKLRGMERNSERRVSSLDYAKSLKPADYRTAKPMNTSSSSSLSPVGRPKSSSSPKEEKKINGLMLKRDLQEAIKAMSRGDVIKKLKRFSLMNDSISGNSTKELRELLWKQCLR